MLPPLRRYSWLPLLVGIFLFGNVGGGGYSVKADFLNAGQLVKGNLVEVAGVKAGR